jgi:molybdate transport system substrate-binding protein
MRTGALIAAMGVCVLVQVLASGVVDAAELRVLGAVAMREVMLDLGPSFERATGHRLVVTFDAPGFIMKRIEASEAFDVVIIPRAGLERLAQAGKVPPASLVDLASVIAGVAVRKGAPRPDISTPEAFKRTLRAAQSVARPDPVAGGSSGAHIARVLERLGLADEVKAKSVIVNRPGDPRATPGYSVADGDADLALHQVHELMAVPGIEVVGPFPAELQEAFVFSAGAIAGTRDAAAARAFIEFLRTPAARAAIKAKGMGPAGP